MGEPSKSKSSNKLMPSRRRRQQQESQQPSGEPLWKEASQVESQSPQKNSLASILGALDRNALEKLKNKPTEDDEVIEDPKQSILANPPLELRTILRTLKIDKNDLQTLLDIPLAIMSAQNVISLVELRNDGSTHHLSKNDPNKLISLLKKYLTPPDEIDSRSSSRTDNHQSVEKSEPSEDIIYKNVEFRTILEDCMTFFAEGKEIQDQLFDSFE